MITITDKGIIDLITSIEQRPMQYFWLRTADFSQQLYVSDVFKRVWGRPVEQLFEYPTAFRDALVQDDETVIKHYHERAHTNNPGEPQQTILSRLLTPTGEIEYLRDACFGLQDSYGNLIGMAGVGKIITSSEWEYDLQGEVIEAHPVSAILKSLREKHIALAPQTNAEVKIPFNKVGNKYIINTTRGEIALTKRELESAQLLLAGNTAKETAKLLDISPRTVEEYLDNIRIKLSCRNKLEITHCLKLGNSPNKI
jgi:DNA-binding CsgD family transcriptional regulator